MKKGLSLISIISVSSLIAAIYVWFDFFIKGSTLTRTITGLLISITLSIIGMLKSKKTGSSKNKNLIISSIALYLSISLIVGVIGTIILLYVLLKSHL